jgi:nickel superoxide dismutase
MKKLNIYAFLLISGLIFVFSNSVAKAHCEIPCGIYEDSLRISIIKEDIETIERSMNMIIKLSEAEKPDYNQIVRWITNKDKHAEKIQYIVWQYFLTQRIKLKERTAAEREKYMKQLELLHIISVYAMKAKQTTDLQYIEKLHRSLDEFSELYFENHNQQHRHKH